MSQELTFALLALGAVLVVVALAGGKLFGSMTAGTRTAVRAVIGVAGLVVIGGAFVVGILPTLQSPASHVSPAASTSPGPQAAPMPPPSAPAPAVAAPVESGPPLAMDVVAAASNALTSCTVPTAPQLPDGAKATLAQMGNAHRDFEAYDAATNDYTKCVDEMVARVVQQAGNSASPADIARLKEFGARAHNVAIEKEQTDADEFNAQIRAYKAKHP
jgi:hypothetical protein